MTLKSLLFAIPLLIATTGISTAEAVDNGDAKSTDTQPRQAHLGIGVEPLPSVLTSHLPEVIGKGRGVLVSDVSKDSPAAKAGLQKNDVLIRYDDQDLYSPEQLVKRVRNDEIGKEIELEYVRAGKLNTVKVALAEKPIQTAVKSNWPGLTKRFDVPLIPYKPDFLTEDQDLLDEGTEWTRFESMRVMKGNDGKYNAEVKYKDEDGRSIAREYAGTRQEVRDAIESDEELPQTQKDQLLRSLDDRGEGILPDFNFPNWGPTWQPWNRELFNWPDLTF